MENDLAYRVAVLVILLITGFVAGYHRWQARSGERISRRDEGILFATCLRLVGLSLWVAVFLYVFAPGWIDRAKLPLPPGVRWAGAAVAALGVVLLFWTLRSLGKNLTDTVVTRSNATLVTHGPYRLVRHPFYVTAGLVMLGTAFLSANGLLAAATIGVLVMLAVRTPNEEAHLVARFGDQYRQYMATTGRFFPRLGKRA